ncbi:MAG: 2Fe-2S iron-sulfur cluster-binding protein [Pseudomonadota bacterium]
MFEVRIGSAGAAFPAPQRQSVLLSAIAASKPWLSSCRNGTCRTCLAQLITGEVVYDIAWPGVSAEEKAENYFLPCVARPASDLVIRPPGEFS